MESNMEAVINISQELYSSLSFFGLTREQIVSDSRKLLALKYFQAKFLSLGKAAELAGMSRTDFIEYLSDSGIPIIDYDEDEMNRELATAESIAQARLS
jgi:predicted HTH domain antitoxin